MIVKQKKKSRLNESLICESIFFFFGEKIRKYVRVSNPHKKQKNKFYIYIYIYCCINEGFIELKETNTTELTLFIETAVTYKNRLTKQHHLD